MEAVAVWQVIAKGRRKSGEKRIGRINGVEAPGDLVSRADRLL